MKMTAFLLLVSLLLLQSTFIVKGGRFNVDSSQTMTVKGNAQVRVDPAESMWAGLSQARRFPIIYSGDLIALRRASTSGTSYWLRCYRNGNPCYISSCPGKNVMLASKWSSCPQLVFKIRAMGKRDGQPVDSGDTVTLTFPYRRHSSAEYFFWCNANSGYKCKASWSHKPLRGNQWFHYNWATFRIFSRNAVDGTPIQLGDIVGLKFPYYTAVSWLYYSGGYFYPRSCHRVNKLSCAKANHPAGFQIFKKL